MFPNKIIDIVHHKDTPPTAHGARSSPDSSAAQDAAEEGLGHACEQHNTDKVMDETVDKTLNEVAIQKLFAENVCEWQIACY